MRRFRKRIKKPNFPTNLSQLLEIENDPSIPPAVKSIAALQVHKNLVKGEDDKVFWTNLHRFSQFPAREIQDAADANFVKDTAKEAQQFGQDEKIITIGNIAYDSKLLTQLPVQFTKRYVDLLETRNPFRAIELTKASGDRESLIRSYLNARQFAAAQSVLNSLPYVSSQICVWFIVAYAKEGDQEEVDRWIKRVQDPTPKQINQIMHVLELYKLNGNAMAEFGRKNSVKPQLSAHDKKVITEINKLVVKHPEALNSVKVYDHWSTIVTQGAQDIPEFVQLLGPFNVQPGELTKLLKAVSVEDANAIIASMHGELPQPTPRDWCALLNKEPSNLGMLLEKMRLDGSLFTPEVVTTLCTVNKPENIVEIVQQAGVKLETHHLLSLWTGGWSRELLEESLAHEPSYALLRAILRTCMREQNYVGAAAALYHYQVNLRLQIEEGFLEEAKSLFKINKRYSRPSICDGQDWTASLARVLPHHVYLPWVKRQARSLLKTRNED